MKTALITGVTGQDGAYLARILIDMNYKVVGTVRSYRCTNKNNFRYLNIEEDLIIEELDLLDISNTIRLIVKYEPDEVYNLASQSSVGLSFDQPIGTFSFNTASVNNLLEAIRLFSPHTKIYQACSSEMFGRVGQLPIALESPMAPISPYGVSKLSSYYMVKIYRNSFGLFASNGILFNHESFLRSENFFIKKVIVNAVKLKKGELDCLRVGNIDIKRDFGYAPDYVEAMWKLMQLEHPDDLIICSGRSVLLRDIVEYVFDKMSLDRSLIVEDDALFRPDEIYEIYGDNNKAKLKLGWDYNKSFFDIIDLLMAEELNYG